MGLGGPFASLALAGSTLAARSQFDPSSFAATLLTGLSWFGLAGFVGNLIPGQVGLKRTDGGHLLGVLRREPHLELSWQLAEIVADWTTGSRPRETSLQEIERLIAIQGPIHLRAAALTVALYVARDRSDCTRQSRKKPSLSSHAKMQSRCSAIEP